jgi:hypothetical protein
MILPVFGILTALFAFAHLVQIVRTSRSEWDNNRDA